MIRWWSLGSGWWERLNRNYVPVQCTKLIFVPPWEGFSPKTARTSVMANILGPDGQISPKVLIIHPLVSSVSSSASFLTKITSLLMGHYRIIQREVMKWSIILTSRIVSNGSGIGKCCLLDMGKTWELSSCEIYTTEPYPGILFLHSFALIMHNRIGKGKSTVELGFSGLD